MHRKPTVIRIEGETNGRQLLVDLLDDLAVHPDGLTLILFYVH